MTSDPLLSAALEYQQAFGDKASPGPGWPMVFIRRAPSQVEAHVYDPIICLILQGAKTATSHTESLHLGVGDGLLVTHDAPVLARTTEASGAVPYVALILRLDLGLIRELGEGMAERREDAAARPFGRVPVGAELRDVLRRWLSLRPGTAEAAALQPLCARELHFRLLSLPEAGALRRLAAPGSPAARIARVIALMRQEVAQPLRLPDLARVAGMGPSSFHAHFKAVTGTTPLQYQKDLRLTAARDRLLAGTATVTETGFAVGYESAAQFSREYARKFGHPPRADLGRETAAA